MKNTVKSVFIILVTAIATSIRAFFTLNMVNPETGNVMSNYLSLMNYFDAALLVLFAVVCVLGIFSKPAKTGFSSKSKPLGVISFLCAATYLFDAFSILFKIFNNFSKTGIFSIAIFAFSIVAALYFVSLGFSMFSKQPILPNSWLPAVVILQSAARLVFEYIASVYNASISEHRFSILLSASFTLFWVVYSKFCFGTKKKSRLLTTVNSIAIFSVSVAIIPRILVFIMPRFLPAYFAHSNVFVANPLYYEDIATLAFLIVFLFFANKKDASYVEDEKPVAVKPAKDEFDDDEFYGDIKGISGTADMDNKVMMETIFGKKDDEPETEPELTEKNEDDISADYGKVIFENEPAEEPKKAPFVVTIKEEDEDPAQPVSDTRETSDFSVIIPEENAEKPDKEELTEKPETREEPEKPIRNASAQDIVDNLLNDILSKYSEDNK